MVDKAELALAVRSDKSGNGSLISCFVQPRASRNQIMGVHGNELKIALTTPPVEGKANKDLCAFFAKLFHVSKGSVAVVMGETNRHKVLAVSCLTVDDIITKLSESV